MSAAASTAAATADPLLPQDQGAGHSQRRVHAGGGGKAGARARSSSPLSHGGDITICCHGADSRAPSPGARTPASPALPHHDLHELRERLMRQEELTDTGRFRIRRDWRTRRCCGILGKQVKYSMYVKDLFHTMVHQPWHRLAIWVALAYVGSWIFYALIGWTFFNARTCIAGHRGVFMDWIYWACETMSTIGYGYLRPTCDATKIMMGVMVLHGVFLDACVFGFVFSKFSASSNRGRSLLISRALCGEAKHEADGDMVTFSFRMVNPRKHPVLHPQLEMYLVDNRPTWFAGLPPSFHKVEYTVSPPLAFLEYPCIVTCQYKPSGADPESHPLYDFWAAHATCEDNHSQHSADIPAGPSAETQASRFSATPLVHLSLVAIFSAQEPAQGSDFEVRRKWSLADVRWNQSFAPMLSQANMPLSFVRDLETASHLQSMIMPRLSANPRLDLSRFDELQSMPSLPWPLQGRNAPGMLGGVCVTTQQANLSDSEDDIEDMEEKGSFVDAPDAHCASRGEGNHREDPPLDGNGQHGAGST